jgi:hypothetical protein
MMAIVYLGYKISDGQLQLVRPQTSGLAFRAKTNARPEVLQDVRRLRDHQATGFQKRWCIWRTAATIHQAQHCVYAIAASRQSRNIPVIGSRPLERKPYEFAASLYAGPVIQLISHVHPPIPDHKYTFSITVRQFQAPANRNFMQNDTTIALTGKKRGSHVLLTDRKRHGERTYCFRQMHRLERAQRQDTF